jgi:hypothetical protein
MAAFAPLDLSGEPRARGRAYGRALAPNIQAHLADWLDVVGTAIGGDPAPYVAAMLRDTDFRTASRDHTPDLLEEVEGIAEGAGAPADLVFALQLLDEEWAYRLRRSAGAPKLEKCSSLAIVGQGDGPTWIGQNMDLGAYTDGHQALLRIASDARGPAALVFTVAGMVGLMGVNAAGVGVCVNSIPQLPSAATGVPVAFVLRRLLQARGLAEAVDLMFGLPHATNQHYVIAEPGAVRSFEAGSGGVTEFHPPERDRVLHTNHPLSDGPAQAETEPARRNSVTRLASLRGRLATGRPGFDEIAGALSAFDDPDHPVCRLANSKSVLIGFTTGSMISALSPGRVESWVSDGPPSARPYIKTSPSAEAVA